MVTKESVKTAKVARRSAFLKSLGGHLVGVGIAILGAVLSYVQDNPTTGIVGGLLGVFLPMLRNWYDKQNANYGKS